MKLDITQAYYTEYFARHKKLPRLDKVLNDLNKPQRKVQSKGDMVLKAMAKAKGVTIK